jgi:Xaa-Pro aminopeptidase
MPWNLLKEIKKRLPNLEIVDATDVFFELRSVKSDEENRCLEQSGEISLIGFEAHLTAWRPGITEGEYYSSVVHAMDAAGAEPPTFCVSSPVRSSAHGLPELKCGDCIFSEASPKYAVYQAQSLQCIVLSKPAPDMKELVNWGIEVWHRFTDLIRPDNTIGQIEQSVDDIVERARCRLGDYAGALVPHCSYAGLGGPVLRGRERLSPIKLSWRKSGPIAGALTRGRPGA